MTSAETSDAAASLANRLGGSIVEIRGELEFSRQVFRDEVSYVVRDPISFRTHRLTRQDYRLLVELRSDRTLADTLSDLKRQGLVGAGQTEAFYQFIVYLHRLGLVKLPVTDGARLYERHVAKKKAKRRQSWMNPIFLKLPLLRPDAFLRDTGRFFRFAFTKAAFFIWIAVVGAALAIGVHEREAFVEGFDGFLDVQNLAFMWTALIVLKIVHEFGHAYACRRYGGAVPEMGVILIALTPVAYVDATSSWGFPSKAKRIVVALAGMYVELFIAAICLFLWEATDDGPQRRLLHSCVVLSSLVTVGFNANPLMKFDGYYVLSDLLEIPNLRQVALDARNRFLQKWFLGVRVSDTGRSMRLQAGLTLFGFALSAYRFLVVIGIAAIVALKFPLLGVLVASGYLLLETFRAVKTLGGYLLSHDETAARRAVALTWCAALLLALPLAAMTIPVPERVHALGVVRAEVERRVPAPYSGEIRGIHVDVGQIVEAGMPVAEIDDLEPRRRIAAQIREVEASARQLRSLRASSATNLAAASRRHDALVAELEAQRERLEETIVRSPITGRIVEVESAVVEGRWCEADRPLAHVVSGAWQIEALLTESDLARSGIDVGSDLDFHPAARPDRSLRATVVSFSPTATDVPTAEQYSAVAGYAVDPVTGRYRERYFRVVALLHVEDDIEVGATIRHRMTGKLTATGESRTVAERLHRRITRFVDRLRQ